MSVLTQQESLEEVAGEQNHYVEHLAEVNKTNDVLATQDIYNENGLLVAKAGTRINNHAAELIISHKLIQPLEEQVKLQNSLDGAKLNEKIQAMLGKVPDMMQIHSTNEFQKVLDRLLAHNLDPILLQELTVMYENLPEHFEKTIYGAWMTSMTAVQLEMSERLVRESFIAGLARDVGFLHISPDALKKKGALSTEEWRSIQCHVVIGQMMLKKMYGNDSEAAQSVLEHHERCDGSGYPLGRTDEHLSIMSQIIGMVDSIQAIRINNFSKCGRNMQDVLPYLKMNKFSYSLQVYNAVRSIIKKAELKPSGINPIGNTGALVTHLLYTVKQMQKAVFLLDQLTEHEESCMKIASYKKLIKVTSPVLLMIRSSGLTGNDLVAWLETLKDKPEESDLDVLLEMELMQHELFFQLKRVCKTINEFSENDKSRLSPENMKSIKNAGGQIEGFLNQVEKCMQTLAESQKEK